MSITLENILYEHFSSLFPNEDYQPIIKRAINIHINIKKEYDNDSLYTLIANYINSWIKRKRVDSLFGFMDT